jgi:predicted DCC family thiol-disulfide oxidoreductase YuxK
MENVKDDFYVEDEPVEEVQHAWRSGERVLVIPSPLRRQLHRQANRLRQFLTHGTASDRRSPSI